MIYINKYIPTVPELSFFSFYKKLEMPNLEKTIKKVKNFSKKAIPIVASTYLLILLLQKKSTTKNPAFSQEGSNLSFTHTDLTCPAPTILSALTKKVCGIALGFTPDFFGTLSETFNTCEAKLENPGLNTGSLVQISKKNQIFPEELGALSLTHIDLTCPAPTILSVLTKKVCGIALGFTPDFFGTLSETFNTCEAESEKPDSSTTSKGSSGPSIIENIQPSGVEENLNNQIDTETQYNKKGCPTVNTTAESESNIREFSQLRKVHTRFFTGLPLFSGLIPLDVGNRVDFNQREVLDHEKFSNITENQTCLPEEGPRSPISQSKENIDSYFRKASIFGYQALEITGQVAWFSVKITGWIVHAAFRAALRI